MSARGFPYITPKFIATEKTTGKISCQKPRGRGKSCWPQWRKLRLKTNHYSPIYQRNGWVVVSNIFHVHPYLGKWSNLTNIFQMGWKCQLDFNCHLFIYYLFSHSWHRRFNKKNPRDWKFAELHGKVDKKQQPSRTFWACEFIFRGSVMCRGIIASWSWDQSKSKTFYLNRALIPTSLRPPLKGNMMDGFCEFIQESIDGFVS